MLKKVFSSILFSLVFFSPSFSESIEKECIEKINGEKVKVIYFKDSDKIKQEWYGEAPIYRKVIEYYKSGDYAIFYFVAYKDKEVSYCSSVLLDNNTDKYKDDCYIIGHNIIYSEFPENFVSQDNEILTRTLDKDSVREIQIAEYNDRKDGLIKKISCFDKSNNLKFEFCFYTENQEKLKYTTVIYYDNGYSEKIYYYYDFVGNGIYTKMYSYEKDGSWTERVFCDYNQNESKMTQQCISYDSEGRKTKIQTYYEVVLKNGKIYRTVDLFDKDEKKTVSANFDKKNKQLYYAENENEN